jgi:hypothetical protein
MSKVAIIGNTSGTGVFTVASPNSNVDRVLTLPDESGTVIVDESNSNAIKVTSAGNVGIGTSSPSKKLEVYASSNSLQIQSVVRNDQAGSGVAAIGFNVSSGAAGDTSASKAGMGLQRQAPQGVGSLCFYNSASTGTADFTTSDERMRIDSAGTLLVGKTSASISTLGYYFSASGFGAQTFSLANTNEAFIYNNLSTAGNARVDFRVAGVQKGYIQWNNTNVAYNTTSDYRLKEDWQPMTGASERVKALKPVNFAWKVDGSRVDGFLAHEAQEVVPECVTGTKDAVDAEGKPNYQGIDQSKLVPLLTAALQEALTKIDALTARIEALESV